MIRNILGIIAGYLVFAISAVLWFNLTGHPPHEAAPLIFEVETLLYGLFFSLLAGLILQLIVTRHTLGMNYILAAVIFIGALTSLLFSGGSHWTQWMTLVIFAPASVLGGYLRIKRGGKTAK